MCMQVICICISRKGYALVYRFFLQIRTSGCMLSYSVLYLGRTGSEYRPWRTLSLLSFFFPVVTRIISRLTPQEFIDVSFNPSLTVMLTSEATNVWNQHNETNVMHFSFNLLRIKGLYMFRTLPAQPQESLHRRHSVPCAYVCNCATTNWHYTHAIYQMPFLKRLLEDEQVMLETCRGLRFSVNWMKNASR
jgi:hypothetical protein